METQKPETQTPARRQTEAERQQSALAALEAAARAVVDRYQDAPERVRTSLATIKTAEAARREEFIAAMRAIAALERDDCEHREKVALLYAPLGQARAEEGWFLAATEVLRICRGERTDKLPSGATIPGELLTLAEEAGIQLQ